MDFQGVFIPPKEYVYGLHEVNQVIVQEDYKNIKIDYTCFSLVKFVRLARANNPNIISLLYTPKDRIVFVNQYGQKLIDNRSLFLSKKAYFTFRGYAHSQRDKIINKQAEGKRLEIINKYGWDCKFGLHWLRLFYEALDIFTVGELVYPCANRGLLVDVRNGKKSLDWVLAEGERLEHLVDEAYVRSDLQYMANDDKIEQVQMEIL